MQARVTLTSASVGLITLASGTFSTRTSPAPYITVALMMIYLYQSCFLTSLIDAERIIVGVRLAVARTFASPVPILLEIRFGGTQEINSPANKRRNAHGFVLKWWNFRAGRWDFCPESVAV
jgi:hypothetical protein